MKIKKILLCTFALIINVPFSRGQSKSNASIKFQNAKIVDTIYVDQNATDQDNTREYVFTFINGGKDPLIMNYPANNGGSQWLASVLVNPSCIKKKDILK